MQLIILSCNPRTIKRSHVYIHGRLTINPPNVLANALTWMQDNRATDGVASGLGADFVSERLLLNAWNIMK